jgi:PTS system nitrogen regulatory IIA component
MYLNLIQVAESFGVSESVIEGWIRDEGMPHTPDRGRLLFDRAQVVQWAATRGLAARAGFLTPDNPAFGTGCRLEPLLRVGGIWRNVPAAEVLDVLAKVVGAMPGATPPIRRLLTLRLRMGGGVTWAPIGDGFALPHPATRVSLGRDSGTVALLLLRDALTQSGRAPDNVPVTRLFFFVASSPRAHLELLGRLTRTLAHGRLRDVVLKGASDPEILVAAAAADGVVSTGNKPEAKR